MGDRTLLERVIILEQSIHALSARLDTLTGSVLIKRKKPGPKPSLNRKKIEIAIRRKIKRKLIKDGFDPAKAGFKRKSRFDKIEE